MITFPPALFAGLLLAALSLGTIEAINIGVMAPDDVLASDRFLAAIYVTTPFTVIGACIAFAAAGLGALWNRARPVPIHDNRPISPIVDLTVACLALVLVGGLLMLAATGLAPFDDSAHSTGLALALMTPVAATAGFYFWGILRSRLGLLEHWIGTFRTMMLMGSVILLLVSVPIWLVLQQDNLRIFLGGASVIFALLYPVLTVSYALLYGIMAKGITENLFFKRAVVVLALFSIVGTADLILNLEERGAVKTALLNHTLVFEPIIMLAYPLFDNDGDGYAAHLGGGDCDDNNAQVYPGAKEIPRNGLDDDCFGGDSPGNRRALRVSPKIADSSSIRGLKDRPNFLMITVDTLSPMHLGYHGYDRATTPILDRVANGGLRFMWAFSQGPQTRISMPSVMTGRYFSELERTPDVWATIHPENRLLAEYLSESGYQTGGVPCHRFFIRGYGLDQGFDDWDLSIVEKHGQDMPKVVTGEAVADRAIYWLQKYTKGDKPFFLWLHFFDVHHQYLPHVEHDFGDSEIDLYDGEIQYTDAQIGRVLDWLTRNDFMDDTYVLLHADHGEAFGGHGYKRHGQHLYNDQVRVPLILSGPGLKPRQVDTPVSLIDVVPTFLDLAGIEAPPNLAGVSLVPYGTETEPPPHPPVFVEMLKDPTHSSRRVIVDWPWKLQYGITFNEYQLFNLAQDPDETKDLVAQAPDAFARLQLKLRRWMSEEVQPVNPRR